MRKILIVCGLMVFGVSLAMPQGSLGPLLFILGGGAVVSAVVVPVAAMILNPFAEWALNTRIGSSMGSVARFIFRIMFSFPGFAAKKSRRAMQKTTS